MGPVEPEGSIRKGPLQDPKPGEAGYKPGQSGQPEKEKPQGGDDKQGKEGEGKEGKGPQKGLTDDQLKQAMTAFAEMQDMIATPQVKDPAVLRAFLSELEGISTAQLALGLLLKAGGGGGGGKGGGDKEKQEKDAGKDERGGQQPSQYPRR